MASSPSSSSHRLSPFVSRCTCLSWDTILLFFDSACFSPSSQPVCLFLYLYIRVCVCEGIWGLFLCFELSAGSHRSFFYFNAITLKPSRSHAPLDICSVYILVSPLHLRICSPLSYLSLSCHLSPTLSPLWFVFCQPSQWYFHNHHL